MPDPFEAALGQQAGVQPTQIANSGTPAAAAQDASGGGLMPAQQSDDPFEAQLRSQERPKQPQGFLPMMQALWSDFDPVKNVKGLAELLSPPGKTNANPGIVNAVARDIKAQHLIRDQANVDWDNGDYLSAASRYAFASMPFLGGWANERLDEGQRGEFSQVIGHALGLYAGAKLPEVIGGAVGKATEGASKAVYENALKPSGETIAERAATAEYGRSNRIPLTEKAVETPLDKAISDYAAAKRSIVDVAPDTPTSLKPAEAASQSFEAQTAKGANSANAVEQIKNSREEFMQHGEPVTVTKVVRSPSPVLGPDGKPYIETKTISGQVPGDTMRAADALETKIETDKQIGDYYGEEAKPQIENLKKMNRELGNELTKNFPELANLNPKYGKLLDFTHDARAAVLHRSGIPMSGTQLMAELFRMPGVKSRIALALASTGRIGGLAEATARVGMYASQLGQYANQQDHP